MNYEHTKDKTKDEKVEVTLANIDMQTNELLKMIDNWSPIEHRNANGEQKKAVEHIRGHNKRRPPTKQDISEAQQPTDHRVPADRQKRSLLQNGGGQSNSRPGTTNR